MHRSILGEVKRSDYQDLLFIHSFNKVDLWLLCATLLKGLGYICEQNQQNLSPHRIYIQGDQLYAIKSHPSNGTKAIYVICSLRQELPGKGTLRQLGKFLPGNEPQGLAASEAHILWPTLLDGEAFLHLRRSPTIQ